ncbi:hypothetical protein SDC9_148849 [bioreactor metagenome]|uniref:Uncharacterized protein n=1 Tax=bioreactor metagenome TaxID=1076179 RepID=A0A645EKI5_9ZZZZ
MDHGRQRLGPDFGQIAFFRFADGEGQCFFRRVKLCVDAGFVASGVDAVPAEVLEKHRIQSVQAIRRPAVADGQTLIAQSGWDAVGSQQGGEQVAFGVAIAGFVNQYIRGFTCHRIQFEVRTVTDFITDEFEAATHQIVSGCRFPREISGDSKDARVVEINVSTGGEVSLHRLLISVRCVGLTDQTILQGIRASSS